MFSLLLAIIYMAFISLGLPDSLLGSAWPVMRLQFGAPLPLAGLISMIIAGGTILSSLLSERLTRRFGAGLVTAVSVGMTALALFVSYVQAVGLDGIDLLNYKVIVGLFVGGMLPFLFSALTMDSVSKAAYKMIEEVRRQFRTIDGILEGTGKPDYTSCVAISTKAALHEMLVPGVI